jgi:hypothetical protein
MRSEHVIAQQLRFSSSNGEGTPARYDEEHWQEVQEKRLDTCVQHHPPRKNSSSSSSSGSSSMA